jgi:hypothetical protein
MSATLTEPPARQRPHRALPRLSSNPETRSVQIGVIGTVLLHLLFFVVAPLLVKLGPVKLPPQNREPETFSIEMAPDEPEPPKEQPKPPAPFKFVEANPDAPDNVPDNSKNFSFMNQQVAQEKPTPDGKNDMPALVGKKDVQSTQIVDGQLTKPQESVPMSPPVEVAAKDAAKEAPKQEQIPLSGFEKQEGEDANSFGSNIAKQAENAKAVPERVEGIKNAPLIQSAVASTPKIDRNKPQERPVLQKQQVRPGIFSDNKFGTMNIGPTAVDAKWSNYGVYLQRMIETVQIQWDRILLQSTLYPPSGTTVTVSFRMDSDGKITTIIDVKNTSSDQGKEASISAITARSPYGKWSDDMIAVLGNSQDMTFTFYYQ